MSGRRKWALPVAIVLVVAISSLALLGYLLGSDWSTFIPDLIIGVVGASAIGLALFALQESSERRRAADERVSVAYSGLLDALNALLTMDLRDGEAALMGTVANKMLHVYEAVEPEDVVLGRWFEAERQLCLHRAIQCHRTLTGLESPSEDEIFKASVPFRQWVAEFTGNVRLWRVGGISSHEMQRQTHLIEQVLRKANAWNERPYPWRQDV